MKLMFLVNDIFILQQMFSLILIES